MNEGVSQLSRDLNQCCQLERPAAYPLDHGLTENKKERKTCTIWLPIREFTTCIYIQQQQQQQ